MTKKEKCFAVFIGCAVFVVFAMILEGTCNALILGGGRAAALMQKPVLFGLYGGLMAGLFEESGRLIAFKTLLKKTRGENSTALYFGNCRTPCSNCNSYHTFYCCLVRG